jgi:hypothetical protein
MRLLAAEMRISLAEATFQEGPDMWILSALFARH